MGIYIIPCEGFFWASFQELDHDRLVVRPQRIEPVAAIGTESDVHSDVLRVALAETSMAGVWRIPRVGWATFTSRATLAGLASRAGVNPTEGHADVESRDEG